MKLALILCVTLVLIGMACSAESGQRIRILAFGRYWWVPKVTIDPTLDITYVPACRYDLEDREIQRNMRMYMPRSYSDLIDNYDTIYITGAAGIRNFKLTWLTWFQDSVEKEGFGLLMSGGSEAFGGRAADPSWDPSPVGDTLPVTFRYVGSDVPYWVTAMVDIVDPDDALMRSLPWEGARAYYMNLWVRGKEGASVLAYADIPGRPKRVEPYTVVWSYGEGRSVAFTPSTLSMNTDWEYFPDTVINLLIYTYDGSPSTDYEVIHNLRLSFQTYNTAKSIAISLMDFADKMGATVRVPELTVEEANDKLAQARQLFLEREMDEAVRTLEEAQELLDKAEEQAVEARNSAMAWVFMIEWLAVTGTFLFSGVILHSLLIKRRLYRQVAVTRGQQH